MHRHQRKTIALAVLLASSALVSLGAQRRIDVEEAVALALANNEGLVQSAISLEAKRRALGLSWNEFLPSLTVGAGFSSTKVASELDSASVAAAGSVTASLSLSGSTTESRRLLRLALESELLSYASARSDLELRVRKKVYSIILDGQTLEVARQNIERSRQSCEQTEAKYKAGLASELDLLSAKVSLAQLGPAADGYADELANDLESLKNLVGVPADEDIAVSGSLDLGDEAVAKVLADARAAKISDDRGVAAAAKSLEAARATSTSVERSKLWPSFTLSATVSPSNPIAYSGTASSASSLTTTASAMASVAIDNYLPGSAAREAMAEARDSVAACEAAYRAAVKTAAASRSSYGRSVESYGASLKALKLNAELAQQSYAASMKAYESGLTTLTSLRSAEGDLQTAKLSALAKSYDLIAAVLDLADEAGLPLDITRRK